MNRISHDRFLDLNPPRQGISLKAAFHMAASSHICAHRQSNRCGSPLWRTCLDQCSPSRLRAAASEVNDVAAGNGPLAPPIRARVGKTIRGDAMGRTGAIAVSRGFSGPIESERGSMLSPSCMSRHELTIISLENVMERRHIIVPPRAPVTHAGGGNPDLQSIAGRCFVVGWNLATTGQLSIEVGASSPRRGNNGCCSPGRDQRGRSPGL
jgi:hypothetical protein